MSTAHTDSTGATVDVELDEPGRAHVIRVDSGEIAGRAHFLPGPTDTERIFHHTVVDKEFSGRGLSRILVAQALADSRDKGLTVVPVCPLFVKKLQAEGDDYLAEGGRFRKATGADLDIVRQSS